MTIRSSSSETWKSLAPFERVGWRRETVTKRQAISLGRENRLRARRRVRAMEDIDTGKLESETVASRTNGSGKRLGENRGLAPWSTVRKRGWTGLSPPATGPRKLEIPKPSRY